MAYAALVSLKQTTQALLSSSHVSIPPPSRQILDVVFEEAQLFQNLLKNLDTESAKSAADAPGRRRMDVVEAKMRDAASAIEDALETHFVNVIHEESPGGGTHPPSKTPLHLTELKQGFDSFIRAVKECIHRDDQEEYGDDDDGGGGGVSSRTDVVGKKSKMIGSSNIISQILDLPLLAHWPNPRIETVALVGMAGIGKTTLAKEVYEDLSRRFDGCAWVDVGGKYRVNDVLQSVLRQLSPDNYDRVVLAQEDGGDYDSYFYESLVGGRRYLLVLNDVWDSRIVDHLEDSLPRDSNYRILILLTTRLEHLGASGDMFRLRLLNKEESWDLLREKVFGDQEQCPPQMERAGKKIAEQCDGLPLLIVTVAGLLGKEKTSEYWNKVADENQNSVFTDAYDRISKVLYPSYEYLPQHLKALCLYLAIFPKYCEIPVAKLNMLWDAEGFFETSLSNYSCVSCLEDFVRLSLVLDLQSSYRYRLKTCGLHSVFWHLCLKEAERNKLFHVLRNYLDSEAPGIRNQRRLCIHNNVLFGIKEAHKSMASISTARSLLCTDPHYQYQIPTFFGHLKLLRVIDALSIRFYEFPMEVVKLIQLRYLGFTYDGKLPASISKLWNLRFLIVHRYLSITKLHKLEDSYLPMEIWDMKELKHLQVTGGDLLDPCDGDVLLPNLVTILDVSPRSCTKGVLEGLPRLKKLRIRIVVAPDACESLRFFDYIPHLKKLKSLVCVCVNPELGSKVMAPPAASSLISGRLQKLSLSGCGYSWEDTGAIASLPFLQVLKLRCYAFRGAKWEIKNEDFRRLRSLVIEDTDLTKWIVGSGGFAQWLECLILKNCYKLEEIHGKFGELLQSVEIVDCNPFVANYVTKLQKGKTDLKLSVQSSWNDGKLIRNSHSLVEKG